MLASRGGRVTSGPATPVLYVGSRLPELSETFVYREVLGLRARGRSVLIASVRRPKPYPQDAVLERLGAEALVVYSAATARILPLALLRYLPLLARALAEAGSADHPNLKSRAKHIVQAAMGLGAAWRLRRRGIGHVHAHMAHVPAMVALYLARALDARFSFTGHAADLFVDRAALAFKLRRADFVSCISHWHREFYREVAPAHGEGQGEGQPAAPGSALLPIVRCSVAVPAHPADPGNEIVTVARLVPKKGIDLLLDAFARADLHGWRLRILGDGPERGALEARAASAGIADRVVFDGARPHAACLAAIATAGMFALPCRTAANGDKDGIPVVLMEAMAAARPVVAGALPSIAELVTPGAGLLVPPNDAAALAAALEALGRDPALRRELGLRARERVIEEFSDEINLDRLCAALDGAAAPSARAGVPA